MKETSIRLTFSNRENFIFCCFILLSVLAAEYCVSYQYVLIAFLCLILANGNAKHIYPSKSPTLGKLIRYLIYLTPLYLPAILSSRPHGVCVPRILLFSCLGAITSTILILFRYSDWKLALSKDMLPYYPKDSIFGHVTRIIYIILSSIGEELFFRLFVIGYPINKNHILGCGISTLLFSAAHVGTKWGHVFNKKDVFTQIIFSFVTSLLFVLSDSIIPCIVAHITFNSMTIMREMLCMKYNLRTTA